MRSLRRDEGGVMQIVEAMLALSILILAISWAVTVAQRPSEAPVESDDLRELTRQSLELVDAEDDPNSPYDTVEEMLRSCQGPRLAESILANIGQASLNVMLVADGSESFVGSARMEQDDDGWQATGTDEPLPTGLRTFVVRYLSEAPAQYCTNAPDSIVSLRIEVWRG